MPIRNFSFRQTVTNYKGLAITGRSPASFMQQTNKKKRKMKENKSGFTWFYNFNLFDDATAHSKKAFS